MQETETVCIAPQTSAKIIRRPQGFNMNSVVQKLLQEKLSALHGSFLPMHHAFDTLSVGFGIMFLEGREEPADTTVSDTEMEKRQKQK